MDRGTILIRCIRVQFFRIELADSPLLLPTKAWIITFTAGKKTPLNPRQDRVFVISDRGTHTVRVQSYEMSLCGAVKNITKSPSCKKRRIRKPNFAILSLSLSLVLQVNAASTPDWVSSRKHAALFSRSTSLLLSLHKMLSTCSVEKLSKTPWRAYCSFQINSLFSRKRRELPDLVRHRQILLIIIALMVIEELLGSGNWAGSCV